MERMRAVWIPILGILLSACGQAPDVYEVDSALEPYVARFQSESALHNGSVPVTSLVAKFGDAGASDRDLASCQIGGGEPPTVVVDQAKWDAATDSQREETLFHELGHCVLRREHDLRFTGSYIPESIMHPLRLSSAVYDTNRDAYLTELFSKHDEF
ncbi:MAG TPA: hypothetical protein VL588_11085 [Bdellovibrionota bacterium]|nr:hypothetical protein [Bdellovibrionota bacterium]